MRKFTLFLVALFLSVGAMAQTPLLEYTNVDLSNGPVELSAADAGIIFTKSNLTIVVDVTLPTSMSGRKAFVCFADPNEAAITDNAAGVKTRSPYMGFGINGSDAGYFASSKTGDRFTASGSQKLTANKRLTIKYVIDNVNKNVLVIADGLVLYSAVFPVLEYEMPNVVSLKNNFSAAKVYIGGGVTSNGNRDEFDGTIHSVKFYEGNVSNTYLRFKSTDTNNSQIRFLVAGDNNLTTSTDGAAANSIFLYNNNNLLSYNVGQYITYQSHTAIGGNANKAVIHSSDSKNPYQIYLSGKYIECNASQTNGVGYYTRNINTNVPSTSGSKFTVVEVTSLPVTITVAKYATFYAPVEVTVPEGVEAYYAEESGIDGDNISLTKIENGVVPANTGVILYADVTEDKTYNLNITTTGAVAIADNLLRGTAAATYITDDAYVLGYINEEGAEPEVGFGKATKNQQSNASWLNNSHKAYLPASAVPADVAQGAASFSFRFPGTTGISEVKGENGEVKAIFDLTGRRVEAITAPGIYIVNGKKTLVK